MGLSRNFFSWVAFGFCFTVFGFFLGSVYNNLSLSHPLTQIRYVYNKTIPLYHHFSQQSQGISQQSQGISSNNVQGTTVQKTTTTTTTKQSTTTSLSSKTTATASNLPQFKCNIYNVSKPSVDKHECVVTKWQPSFHICIHPVSKDIYVSKSIKTHGIWEGHLMKVIQRLLNNDPQLGLIDIGANIGQYALLAAAMNRKVVAVEARLLHVEMIHHAVRLNDMQNRFTLLHNAITDSHNVLSLKLTESYNQGHTQIAQPGTGHGIPSSENTKVPGIFMDDILQVVSFSKAIIKMDIEGAEHQAIGHCEKLLKAVYIPYIFMEWLWQKSMPNEQKIITSVLMRNGYSAYSLAFIPLQLQSIRNWPTDIVWKHKNATT